MKIIFNNSATKQNMMDFRTVLLNHIKSANIKNEMVLDLKTRQIYFPDSLSHEEDTIILTLLGQYSGILETKFSDHKQPH